MSNSPKHLKILYQTNIKKALLISLCIIIITFHLFPVFERQIREQEPLLVNIVVEDIPVTQQGVFKPPPPKPAIPIPSEDEQIPIDETIEETELNFDNTALSSTEGYKSVGTSFVAPRPITEVIPEYPEQDYKKGITGVVKLHVNVNEKGKVVDVIILENTTKSSRCGKAAKEAAFRCRYIPAKQGRKPVASWTIRVVTFDIPD